MTHPDQDNIVERIHSSGRELVLSITGGGSGAISALLEVPGASAAVLEANVPYSATALADWLGGTFDQASSEATARAMAMASFERARDLSATEPPALRGIGATASLATTRPKRGPHRVHVAWQSVNRTVVVSVELTKDMRSRAEEEAIARDLVLDAAADACGVEAEPLVAADIRSRLVRREKQAPAAWSELLLGRRATVAMGQGPATSAPAVVFPGAFRPLHAGHVRMAEIAAARCGAPVTFELSITNVDKPPLDFIEIDERLAGLAGQPVLLTRAATFAEKAWRTPGAAFVVGADTIARIGEVRYYGDDDTRRDDAIATIAGQGCRFLVFGRLADGTFRSLAELDLPAGLRALCDEVPEAEFRDDVSSTELRAQ
jgi:nicotinamide mononucleotide (NMN) deamidase PncC